MYEFPPRPKTWRLAAWITNFAVSIVETSMMWRAGLRSWFVYATPWDGVRERLIVRTVPVPGDGGARRTTSSRPRLGSVSSYRGPDRNSSTLAAV